MDSKYKANIEKQEILLQSLKKRGAVYGNIRLVLALLTAAFVVLLIVFWFSVLYMSLLIVWVGCFVYFSVLHADISSSISYHKGLIAVNSEYLARIDGRWKDFADCGAEFVDINHDYSVDLDIFGAKSLFQLINVTKTPYGRTALKNDLSAPSYTLDQIAERQEAIVELSNLDNLAQDFMVHSKQIGYDKNLPKVVEYVKQKPQFLSHGALKLFLSLLPLLLLGSSIILMSLGSQSLRIVGSCILAAQALVWLALSPKTLSYLGGAEKIHYSLSDYSRLCAVIQNQQFDSKLLKKLRGDMISSTVSAVNGTRSLARVLSKIQVRSSGIMYILLNFLFLWDIGCAISLSNWTKKYGKHVEDWFISLGEFESLLSFSTLGGTLGTCSVAKAVDEGHVFHARQIGHPLIDHSQRVCNDFCLQSNINIISGSNMSGKTTFLRTLGINLVLAKNGSFVCAEDMTFSSMRLVSSMRISDDLSEGVSTFYRELKKIKRVLDVAKENQRTFFLIDEIFRGTNSTDRTAGAQSVITKLKEYGAYGLLTTHDLKMCEDTNGHGTKNYSFSEHYKAGELKFDYKIKQGIAKTTNGEYLMRLIGIM